MSFRHRYSEEVYSEEAYKQQAPACYEVVRPPPARCTEESYAYDERERFSSPRQPCVGGGYGRYHHANPTNFQRDERLGELGAVAAGAFATYETHDHAHTQKRKEEAELAAVAALGSGGYAAYEHHEKEKYYDGCNY